MQKQQYILIVFILLIFSCVTNAPNKLVNSETEPVPQWLYTPPHEEGLFYGIGGDIDLEKARMKSIVDISLQFRTQVESVLLENTSIQNDQTRSVVSSINNQISEQTVNGAKLYDQFLDEQGNYWVLSRVNTNCVLDITESILLSYSMELKQSETDLEKVINEVVSITSAANPHFPDTKGSSQNSLVPALKTIKVDGKPDDWGGIWSFIGEGMLNPVKGDISTIHFAVDSEYLYFKLTTNDEKIDIKNLYYSFQFSLTKGTLFFDLYSPHNPDTNLGYTMEMEGKEYGSAALSSKVKLKSDQVLEVALPLKDLMDTDVYDPQSIFKLYVRDAKTDEHVDYVIKNITLP